MDYTLQQSSDPSSWMYSQQHSNEPLQEPVPFEDFQFSFGLDPGFVMPVPLEMPEPPSLNDQYLSTMDYQLGEEPTSNNPLLDENDQKVFSQFLDAFFVDKDGQMSNAEEMANQFSTMYEAPPLLLNDPPMDPYQVATSMFLPKPRPSDTYHPDDEDEHRRSSILQSLDQQKQFHQRLNRVVSVQQLKEPSPPSSQAIFLQQSNQVSAPFITKHPTGQRYHAPPHAPYPPPEQRQNTSQRSLSTPTRRNKSHKELLTEEEKRSNHIASEQKRRSTIRNGFKDLTDIVPTLKNINNSKSTVLFKAVDYIKYLEKRNNSLKDKMNSLEVRIKVEGRVSNLMMPVLSSPPIQSEPSPPSDHSSPSSSTHGPASSSNTSLTESNGVAAALLAHKSQQKQLMALQEQLQYHQRLLAAQQDDSSSSAHSSPQSNDLYPRWTFDSKSSTKVDQDEPLKLSA